MTPPSQIGQTATIVDPVNPGQQMAITSTGSVNVSIVAAGTNRTGGRPAQFGIQLTIVDPTNPGRKLAVNSDGSINLTLVSA